MAEEAVMAVPAGAGKTRPHRGMGEASAAEGGTADMGETGAAHAADMHAAEAARVHAATTEMPAARMTINSCVLFSRQQV